MLESMRLSPSGQGVRETLGVRCPKNFCSLIKSAALGHSTLTDVDRAIHEGASVNAQTAVSPLMCAVQADNAELVELLLLRRADVNAPDGKGVCPLHVAVFDGMTDVITLLLSARADLESKDQYGQTPLFFAPDAALCKRLQDEGGDVNAINHKGQTALHLAAHSGVNEVVVWLTTAMKSELLDYRDHHGRTAAYCAAHWKLHETLRMLEKAGANVHLQPGASPPRAERQDETPSLSGATVHPVTSHAPPSSPTSPVKPVQTGRVQDKKESHMGHPEKEERSSLSGGERTLSDTGVPRVPIRKDQAEDVPLTGENIGVADEPSTLHARDVSRKEAAVEGVDGSANDGHPKAPLPGTEVDPSHNPAADVTPDIQDSVQKATQRGATPEDTVDGHENEATCTETHKVLLVHSREFPPEPNQLKGESLDHALEAREIRTDSALHVQVQKDVLPPETCEEPHQPSTFQNPGEECEGNAATRGAAPKHLERNEADLQSTGVDHLQAEMCRISAETEPHLSHEVQSARPRDKETHVTMTVKTPLTDTEGAQEETDLKMRNVALRNTVLPEEQKVAEIEKSRASLKKLEEYELRRQEEKAVLKVQSLTRGRTARLRAAQKKNNSKNPVPKWEVHGCVLWQVTLTKRPHRDRYGFAHLNGKNLFLKERTYGDVVVNNLVTDTSPTFGSTFGAGEKTRPASKTNDTLSPRSPVTQLTVVDTPAPEVLVVKNIAEQGLLAEWNDLHEDAEIKSFDRVCAVNEATTVKEMSLQLRAPSVTITIMRYPERFFCELVRRPDMKQLGFHFDTPDEGSALQELRISEVTGGLLEEANLISVQEGKFHFVVLGGMKIECVNDVEGSAKKMAELLRTASTVKLRVRRAEVAARALNTMKQRVQVVNAFRMGAKLR